MEWKGNKESSPTMCMQVVLAVNFFSLRQILYTVCILVAIFSTHSLMAEAKRVGVIAPFTGRVAIIGEAIKNSVIMENEEAEEPDSVIFYFEDDGYLPHNTVNAAQKLIHTTKVDALLLFGSGPSLAAAEIAARAGVPMVAMAYSAELTEKYSNVFRIFLSVDQQIKLINDEIKRRKYRSVAIMTAMMEATKLAREIFLEENREKVLLDEEVLPGDTDLRSSVAKIKSLNPDGVFLMLYPPQISIAAKMLRISGYKGELFGLSLILNPEEISAAGGAMDEAWAVGIADREAGDFISRYQRKYGKNPWHDGAIAYDIARVIRKSLLHGGVEKYLGDRESFRGVYGIYQKNGKNNFQPPAEVMIVRIP